MDLQQSFPPKVFQTLLKTQNCNTNESGILKYLHTRFPSSWFLLKKILGNYSNQIIYYIQH